MIVVECMTLSEPVPYASLNLAKKVEITLGSPMSEITNEDRR
jgi:hypothetical protein